MDVRESSARELFRESTVRALVEAGESGDVVTIDRLIKKEDVDVNAQGSGGVTPLFRSLVAANRVGYKSLLRHGANPNILDDAGSSVVFEAAKNADSFWLKEALANGGNANLINNGNPHVPNCTPIFYAVTEERIDCVALLVSAGAKLDHQDQYGYTPLHHASETAAYDIALLLLEAGADFRIKNMHGQDIIDFHFRGRTENIVLADQRPWFRKVVAFLTAKGVSLGTN